eukprot:CAMPEP_0202892424 /NCGR_PEP_ID=MMETSP1392-20130828/2144_1 /ASSEMBLY_ACC=CAM_ASM_000868 /TAXON_ID=225041 /ORGANISM="Chlamydomonas chlamydogama, Strain SAG 11-48b" /LENGTH=100 /DNA_ID=CAMNT_0049576365 /DNA_START=500 /DNA_END=802 /DNA_ORIENTATION=+
MRSTTTWGVSILRMGICGSASGFAAALVLGGAGVAVAAVGTSSVLWIWLLLASSCLRRLPFTDGAPGLDETFPLSFTLTFGCVFSSALGPPKPLVDFTVT